MVRYVLAAMIMTWTLINPNFLWANCAGLFEGKLSISDRITLVERILPRHENEFIDAVSGAPVGEVLSRFVRLRQEQAIEIRTLAENVQDPVRKQIMLQYADLIDVKPGSR